MGISHLQKLSEEDFKKIFEEMLEGIQILDEDLRYLYVNPAAAAQGRASQDNLIGKKLTDVYPSSANTPLHEALIACAKQKVPHRFQNHFEYPDGAKGWFELGIFPVPMGVMIRSIDITDKKRNEEKVLEKIRDLEEFTFVASHDLRAPLRHISSFATLLKEHASHSNDEKVRKWTDFIVAGTERMRCLLDDLSEYSKSERQLLNRSEFCLQDLVNEISLDLSVDIEEAKAQVTAFALPKIYADRIKIRQVLQNLVENGIKFRKPDQALSIHITCELQEKCWRIVVSDNGIGIKSEFFDRIFKPFQRLHRDKTMPGTGMGLAICRKNIALHGGELNVRSEPGQGSEFFFSIPHPE